MFFKVIEHPSLFRDSESGAIVNTNSNDRENYLKQRAYAESRHKVIQEQQEEISKLKNEMAEIKTLLLTHLVK